MGNHHSVEQVVESTASKLLGRYGVPLLLGILGIFLMRTLDTIERQQADMEAIQAQQAAELTRIRVLLDERVVRQVDTNTTDIRELQDRMSRLEGNK